MKVKNRIKNLYNKKTALKHEKIRKEGKIDSEVLNKLFKFLPKDLSGKSVLDAGGGSGIFRNYV